jgi:hypothetical protein
LSHKPTHTSIPSHSLDIRIPSALKRLLHPRIDSQGKRFAAKPITLEIPIAVHERDFDAAVEQRPEFRQRAAENKVA